MSGLPEQTCLENVSWSPDGRKIACTHTTDQGLELWVIGVADAKAKKHTEAIVNDATSGLPYEWFADGEKILYRQIVTNRGTPPEAPAIPTGPVIQENTQGAAPVRTYQDLLKSPYDEKLFSYFAESALQVLDLTNGTHTAFGIEGIIVNNISLRMAITC